MKDFYLIEDFGVYFDNHTKEKVLNVMNDIEKLNVISNERYNYILRMCFNLLLNYYEITEDVNTYDFYKLIIFDLIEKYGYLLSKLMNVQVYNLIEIIAAAKFYNLEEEKINSFINYFFKYSNTRMFHSIPTGMTLIAEDLKSISELNHENLMKYLSLFECTSYKYHYLTLVYDIEMHDNLNYDILYEYLHLKMQMINELEITFSEEDFDKLETIKILNKNDYCNEKLFDLVEYIIFNCQ